MKSLIPLLKNILSSYREGFKTKGKGNWGVFAYISKENLEKRNFKNSDLCGANLKGAILVNVSLNNVYLLEVELRKTNITKDQIKFAFTDEGTLFHNCILNK